MFSKAGNRSFLQKLLRPYHAFRPFSSFDALVTQADSSADEQQRKIHEQRTHRQFVTKKQASKDRLRKQQEKVEAEQAYKNTLDNLETKAEFFQKLISQNSDDHSFIRRLKGQIGTLLQQELDY